MPPSLQLLSPTLSLVVCVNRPYLSLSLSLIPSISLPVYPSPSLFLSLSFSPSLYLITSLSISFSFALSHPLHLSTCLPPSTSFSLSHPLHLTTCLPLFLHDISFLFSLNMISHFAPFLFIFLFLSSSPALCRSTIS